MDQSLGGSVIGLCSPDDKKVVSECKKSTFFPVGQANRGSSEAVEFGLTEKRYFLLGKPAGELGRGETRPNSKRKKAPESRIEFAYVGFRRAFEMQKRCQR